MLNEQPKYGDRGDFVEREDKGQKNSPDSYSGTQGKSPDDSGTWEDFIESNDREQKKSPNSGFDSKNTKAEQDGSAKETKQGGEGREASEGGRGESGRETGTDFEKKFFELKKKLEEELWNKNKELEKRLEEKEKLYQQVLDRLGANDSETKEQVEEIKSGAEQSLNKEVPSETDPWGITAESIDREHLKDLYGRDGRIGSVLDKIFSGSAYRRGTKKARAELKEIHTLHDKEAAFQNKKQGKIEKINPKKERMEKKVEVSKLKLDAERDRKITPAKEKYDRLKFQLEVLNEKKYSFFKEPIAKISNFIKKQLSENSVKRAKNALEGAEAEFKPKEEKHQKLVDQLDEINSNIDNLKKEIGQSENVCKSLEERILRIADLDSASKKENAQEKTATKSSKTPESSQKHSAAEEESGVSEETREDELKEGRFLRELAALRGVKDIKELGNKVLGINENYGGSFSEYGEYLISENRHPYQTEKGETVLLKAFKSGDQFKIVIKKIENKRRETKKAA